MLKRGQRCSGGRPVLFHADFGRCTPDGQSPLGGGGAPACLSSDSSEASKRERERNASQASKQERERERCTASSGPGQPDGDQDFDRSELWQKPQQRHRSSQQRRDTTPPPNAAAQHDITALVQTPGTDWAAATTHHHNTTTSASYATPCWADLHTRRQPATPRNPQAGNASLPAPTSSSTPSPRDAGLRDMHTLPLHGHPQPGEDTQETMLCCTLSGWSSRANPTWCHGQEWTPRERHQTTRYGHQRPATTNKPQHLLVQAAPLQTET